MKKKIYITRRIPEAGIEMLKAKKNFDVKVSPYDRVLSSREIIKNAKGCDALLCLLTDQINGKILDGIGKQLKIVANYAVGFNNINLEDAKKRKIMVTNTPGNLISESVAEHTFALMIGLAKRMVEGDNFMRHGKYKGWGPMLLLGTDLHDKTVGIVGLGAIGHAVAQRASLGFNMKILYYDIKRNREFENKYKAKYVKMDELLKKSDFVTLHVPLLKQTHHLMSEKQFKLMKNAAFIINTSRGPIIDEYALVSALRKKEIAGAGIDVYECEPKLGCKVSNLKYLRKANNVIITPHIASASFETRSEMAEIAAKNIIAALSGKTPPNLVK
ncbi:MAG: D-glycerate dehydrogenase [Parcubacteria group bacterium CG10_big_fil_rev_8_21_14_0_10_36_14]|nr:MAG: D-glycerate dehydrogenase [Parcubacteria group bacterium CG10_big_fil_rev_8_21_14_0_10_36_14]